MRGTAGGLQAPVPSGPPTKIAGVPAIDGFWATADGATTKKSAANAAMAKRIFTISPVSSTTPFRLAHDPGAAARVAENRPRGLPPQAERDPGEDLADDPVGDE